MGPVQVLVVGFDRPAFSGEVLAEFARLREAGIVRLLDLLLLSRSEDGTIETLDAPDGLAADFGELAADLLGGADSSPPNDGTAADAASSGLSTWSLAEAIPPGSGAAVALVEHMWAAPLVDAIRRAGGAPLEETWLAPGDVETLDSLIRQRQR
jgi:Family of unknown function (DUF6325)